MHGAPNSVPDGKHTFGWRPEHTQSSSGHPFARGSHLPFLVGMLQALHCSVQGPSQQTPSTHSPVAHSVLSLHSSPCLVRHAPPAQTFKGSLGHGFPSSAGSGLGRQPLLLHSHVWHSPSFGTQFEPPPAPPPPLPPLLLLIPPIPLVLALPPSPPVVVPPGGRGSPLGYATSSDIGQPAIETVRARNETPNGNSK